VGEQAVSVVIPVHNCQEWLRGTLESVYAQSHRVHEIVVADDASTDDSMEIVRNVASDARIVQGAWRNAAAARNAAIQLASGTWIAFLDADSRWHSDHLERAMSMLSASEDCMYVSPQSQAMEFDNISRRRDDVPIRDSQSGLKSEDLVEWRLRRSWGFGTVGFVVSRARLSEIGGFAETQLRRHDIDLLMRAIVGRSWSADVHGTWWTPQARDGDISSNRPECRYFGLRALIKNEAQYQSRSYLTLIRRDACRAAGWAARESNWALFSEVSDLAWPFLSIRERVRLRLLSVANRRSLSRRNKQAR